MQPFKQIPYQNYIELRFNQKNLHQAEQQQALLKYKRNAQLLAEIFSFERKGVQSFDNECNVTQQQVDQFKKQIEKQQKAILDKKEQVKKQTQKFQQLLAKTTKVSSQQQLKAIIKQLKENDMYDDCHPFFVEDSPFYLSSTQEDYLEVKDAKPIKKNLQSLTFLQIN